MIVSPRFLWEGKGAEDSSVYDNNNIPSVISLAESREGSMYADLIPTR